MYNDMLYNETHQTKIDTLFTKKSLTKTQISNSQLNLNEMAQGREILDSLPRRIIFEITNACNLNCIMCGRNFSDFCSTQLSFDELCWFKPFFNIIEEVVLMGWGEPTVHPDFIEILKMLDLFDIRKYFCTNGVKLAEITKELFDYHVDIISVSLNGATEYTNDMMRSGKNFKKIINSLKVIVEHKIQINSEFPYLSLVFCVMRSNLHELPLLVDLAAELGLNRVKVVYLTAFSRDLANEILWGHEVETQKIFEIALKKANSYNIEIMLPYISGLDPAGQDYHRDCSAPWRDLFIGSDGFIRPCMSTAEKFFKFDKNKSFHDIWNAPEFIQYRHSVNSNERMSIFCKNCYQSSHCNWNLEKSFMQANKQFSPNWTENKDI